MFKIDFGQPQMGGTESLCKLGNLPYEARVSRTVL